MLIEWQIVGEIRMNMLKRYMESKKILQFITYIYSAYLIFGLNAIPGIKEDYVLKISVCALIVMVGRDLYDALLYYKYNYVRKYSWIIMVISSLVISFSVVGNDLFYDKNMGFFETSLENMISYFLVCILFFMVLITGCYWLSKETKELKRLDGENRMERNIFYIYLTSGFLYLIAYNPANMFPDTYSQLKQAHGIEQLFDWHPVFHTLILKFFVTIFQTPSVFAAFHIILFSYVMTKWLGKLHSKGLNKKIIYIFSCSFYFNIAYGLLITNIWKDNLYNICLIWCSYLLYDIIDDFERFNSKKANYLYLFICLVGIFCCRHNGIIPAFCTIIFLAVFSIKIKEKKKMYLLCLLFVIAVLVKSPIYKMLKVIPNEPGVMFTPLVHDVAAVIAYNNGITLSYDIMQEMESILTIEQWKQQYNSTDSDSYTFYYDEFMVNLNAKSTKEMINMYLGALKDEPLMICGARLMSSQIMWSTFKRVGSGDYLYEKKNTVQIEEQFGYARKENILTEVSNCLYDFFENSLLLNTIFFRTGMWFCILILSICTIIVYCRNIKLLFILIPIISNMASLAVSMTCQHLRYVWALYIISILFLFIVMVNKTPREKTNGSDCSFNTML